MPDTELQSSERDGLVAVALRGDLDLVGEAAITALVARGQSLITDMSGLDFMDHASLRALTTEEWLVVGAARTGRAVPSPCRRRMTMVSAAAPWARGQRVLT